MNPVLMQRATWLMVPALFGLDIWTKNLIVERFYRWESVSVVGSLLKLTYVRNTGAAFGILQDHPMIFTWLTGIAIVVLSAHKYMTTNRHLVYQLALGLILSGATGNFFDRLRFGYVVDFIDVGLGEMRWPAFNVADSCISVGVTLILILSFLTPEKHDSPEAAKPQTA